jgi:glycosyltransferase involved in cell wall biosynthesis
VRLLVVSHTPHYHRDDVIVGWGPTVREIDELSTLFEQVVHIAPLYNGPAPGSALAYQSPRVKLHPVHPAGGELWRDKLCIPLRYPGYVRAILRERKSVDVIHVRAPANISLLTMVLLGLLRQPTTRWAKYAGDWSGGIDEPWSYRFQRWWLAKGLHRGVVTVNGRWANHASHVHPFLNPCLTETELEEGLRAGREKKLDQPIRLLFVGRMEAAKGAGICLETLAGLQKVGIESRLDMIGDGEEAPTFTRQAQELGIASRVRFHGGLPRASLGEYYGPAHFILLPSSCSEGWPKVLSEGMAYGAVPIATAISSIPQFFKTFGVGIALTAGKPELFSSTIADFLRVPARWEEHSRNAIRAARQFSYNNYLKCVGALMDLRNAPEVFAA